MPKNKKKSTLNNAAKRGRPFKKGNLGGPGRGKGKRDNSVENALNIIREAITEEDLTAVVQRMVKAAKAGNVRAAQLLLVYRAGKPKETVEISGADGDAVKVERRPMMEGRRMTMVVIPVKHAAQHAHAHAGRPAS